MSFFEKVPFFPMDPIFGLTATYVADPRPKKVNLMVGLYRTEDLKTPVMSVVKKAEKYLLEHEKSKEYLSFEGDKEYLESIGSLIFKEANWQKIKLRTSSFQTVGGTGALRLGGDFIKQEIGSNIYIPHPSWPNHKGVFTRCGLKVENYPYYDRKNQRFDFEKLYHYFSNLEQKSVIVLHGCCHNPTGIDPTLDQWKELLNLFRSKRFLPFFDFAYQGFGKGVQEDAAAIRLFVESGMEMLVACSFSKNFGLYGERVGGLFVLSKDDLVAERVTSALKLFVRTNISNPPAHGARIVSYILRNPALKEEWEKELSQMRHRVISQREALAASFMAKTHDPDFSYLKSRLGLFCDSGLSEPQVDRLIHEYGIYMTKDGRMNVCGLNKDNLEYVVDAILKVYKT